ncbi:MAG: CocE/NonD family hydrolase [Cyanobacteria bacterium CRU_2_1]|nr:CocE/NonD family hydrolase [Cyanobacteria bacterium CRU_2_1]
MLPVRPRQTLSMNTRDGVRLDADLYYPDRKGDFPVLLMRQPYGRSIASTVVYAHPSWYAAQGYIVVIQDVRGRGSSNGEFNLFATEIEDGYDTVNWAATLPQSTGEVGMYGFSYQGMTQLYAAIDRPAALKTLCPSMAAYDLYHDWAYEGGAFCYQLNLGWAIQLAAETTRRKGDSETYRTLYAASRNPPLHDPVFAHSGILRQLAPDSHYHDWLDHPEPDEYWDQLSPKSYLQKVDLPMLHIGGWFDTYMRGTLNLYHAIASRSQFPQFLIVGPWAHLPWGRRVGAIDYGADANSPIDRLQLRWFDHFLKGIDTGLLDEPPVCLFEMGSNQWRRFAKFPTNNQKFYVLTTTGLAAVDDRQSTLTPSPHPPIPSFPCPFTLPDTFIHDPWRPVPSQGGHAAFPAGAFDRASIDCRTDVVTYTTEPLTEDLHLAGEIAIDLYCDAEVSGMKFYDDSPESRGLSPSGSKPAPSFDLCAILSEVKPNGSVYNFSQGYHRVNYPPSPHPPISPSPHSLTLQPTCICIPKGSAIRLSISAACFPAYAVNAGTGLTAGHSRLIDANVISVTIYGDGDRPSQVRLPIL